MRDQQLAKALYRKYRSKTLDEILGQDHVTDVLQRALKQGKIAHAYLLTGPRGVGKTSIARILAHEINHLDYAEDTTHLDIIEIDAASNNGVEDIRDLRDKVQIAPVSAPKKIYIIDEVHMLSKPAFNALLKTLEEPPEHVVFILATTDLEKLPATIISRTQRFHLRLISEENLVQHLRHIAKQEGIKIDDAALSVIAARGAGSFRDSISLLDQLSSLADKEKGIARDLALKALGLGPEELINDIVTAYEKKDLSALVGLLHEAEQSGIQMPILANQLIEYIRKNIHESPQLLPLLDGLIEVGRSSHPAVKLLTILAAPSTPKPPKSAALNAPAPTISAPVAALRKQTPVRKSTNERPKESPQKTVPLAPITQPSVPVGPLDWQALLEHIRERHMAIYSVLSKCTHEKDGSTLKLYTGNAFYKKKLDDSRYRIAIAEALTATGAGDWTLETLPTAPPPKDSQAAAVAAIMGGGEEVNVEA